jgi:hypothetical protein
MQRVIRAWVAAVCLLASARIFAGDVLIEEKVTVFSPEAMDQWKLTFRSLDDWITRVSRKDWRLLYRKETKRDYIALFLDQDQRVVVSTWRLDGLRADQWSINITGDDKRQAYISNQSFGVDLGGADYNGPDFG